MERAAEVSTMDRLEGLVKRLEASAFRGVSPVDYEEVEDDAEGDDGFVVFMPLQGGPVQQWFHSFFLHMNVSLE